MQRVQYRRLPQHNVGFKHKPEKGSSLSGTILLGGTQKNIAKPLLEVLNGILTDSKRFHHPKLQCPNTAVGQSMQTRAA
eukprot:6212236-Pleurochrysis_carterae.AAC.3